ncbi:hypothetical protein RB195_007925 [Necator americanus]|uniref:non-specific serine/threonine protein kinase n=1 Tax=Necator americanus TaxID=51031 RepID=A0ABR1C251_NECAM
MLTDGQPLSVEHALNGLPQLSRLIHGLLDKKIKKVGEREAAKRDIATIVSNCLPFYTSGLDNEVYPRGSLVKDLCALALNEVEENAQKVNKTYSSWKTCSLELTVNVLNKLCDKRLLCSEYLDFFNFIFAVLKSRFAESQSWVENDVTNVLAKFVTTSTCFIAPAHVKDIWSLVWLRLPTVIDTNGKSCGNYLRIARSILKHINKTTMVDGESGRKLVAEMIVKFFEAAKKGDSSIWSGQIEYALDLLSLVIDDWGIECREVILQHCIPFASLLVEKLDFSSASVNDLGSAWTFFDRLFHLAIPDCKASCLVPKEAYVLAQNACEVLQRALFSLSLSRIDYELKMDYVPLFARLLVIAHVIATNSSETMDATVAVFTQHSKRRKEESVLEMITEWSLPEGVSYKDRPHFVVSCLLLAYEITSRWSHRIDADYLASMAAKLWIARDRIKFNWQLPSYCQLLKDLLRIGAFDRLCDSNSENGLQTAKNLWKFALTSAHAGCGFDASCLLMISILQRFKSLIGEDDDLTEAICDVLSRSSSPHGPIFYEMITYVLTELEFDELRPFPGVSEKRRGIDQWRFRCQVAEWLISHAGTQCDLSEPLYVLCHLHPQRSRKFKRSLPAKLGIERDLELFELSEIRSCPEAKISRFPVMVIPELLSYISQLFEEIWTAHELTSAAEISLWCSYLMFRSKLNVLFESQCTVLTKVMGDRMRELIRNAEPSLLAHIKLHNVHPSLISSDVLYILSSRLSDFPALGAYLVMQPVELNVSAEIIRDVMRGIEKHLIVSDSMDVRKAAGNLLERFTAEVDTVPDLLLLLDECAGIIDRGSRQRLVRKISEIIDEDLIAGEYDVNEAGIYRRLLSMYNLRSCEPGECEAVDFNRIGSAHVIRYLGFLSHSLLNWEHVLKLLERAGSNVVLVTKLIRVIINDPVLFHLHSLILVAVVRNENVMQACEQLIPDFGLLFDCHCNSIMLAQPYTERVPHLNVLSSLRSEQLVECFRTRKPKILNIEHFTAAFFLYIDDRHKNFFVSSFWKQLLDEPHMLLTSLWKAGKLSIRRKEYYLLLHNLRFVASSGHLQSVNASMAQGFLLTLYSVISSILHFVAKRTPGEVDGILQLVSQFGCFSADEIVYLRYSVSGLNSKDPDTAEELFGFAVEDICCRGVVEDVRVFHCDEFWKCMRSFVELQPKPQSKADDSVINKILSRLTLVWDVLPSARPYLACIMSSFGDSSVVPCRKLECHYAIDNVRDYCHLVVTDHRLESAEVFISCLRILSCEAFRNLAILRPRAVGHNSHRETDFVSRLIISMYRELVPLETDENSTDFSRSSTEIMLNRDPICAADSTNSLFCLISKYACCLPKLCQILMPFVLAMDDSNAEAAIRIVLHYAVLIMSTETHPVQKSSILRMAHCLAECVDGIGLHRLSQVKLDYNFYFDGMCALIKCCLLSNLPKYAFAVANILYDAIISHQGARHLAAFDGVKIDNGEFLELLKRIFLSFGSTSALRALPTELQNDDNVRVLFSRARLDWLDIISNPKASSKDLLDAYTYCGIAYSGNCRELKYALAIRRDQWTEISYPKKLLSHEERLFAFLYSAAQCSSRATELAAFLETIECADTVECELPNPTTLNNLRDFSVIHLKSRITVEDLKALSINHLIIFTIYLSRFSRLRDLKDVTQMCTKEMSVAISELSNRFANLHAFVPCLSLLRYCTGDWLTVEKCRTLIAKGEHNTAEHLLRILLQSSGISQNAIAIEARCLLAKLLADHKNMLDEALILLQNGLDNIAKSAVYSDSHLRILMLLHRLAARQLTGIEEHMESRAFRMRQNAISEWTRQRSIASQGPPTHASRRIECELKCEREAVETIKRKLILSAVGTVSAGLEALELLSEPYIKQPHQPKLRTDAILRHIFPLIDVIFRFDKEKDVVKAFRMYVANGMVPAVWIPVVGHIMNHCFSKSILAPVIRTMIVKLIIAYPYHVLHTVLMYKFNENYAPIVETILEEAERRVPDKSAKSRLHQIIEEMTVAHVAYMQFVSANVNDARFFNKRQIKGSTAVQYEMLDKLSIVRLTDILQRVPLPIIEQKFCMPGDYSGADIVKWGPMERVCIQADGLSAPKILGTKGSDGKLYKLIWKSEDVRQDCLVEQLFSIVNSILNDGEDITFLRTYKVVPLDSKCGIIEFCQGTVSLKQLLCGLDLLGGLHAEEEPQDESALRMRNELKDVARNQVNQASTVFREACARFHPVFRHFFYRNYTTVPQWTRMIDNYRKSLAQWSIVTYVVGLGDRHLSNVLFETDTCKLVHIDLGMILEYSKRTLPIPERVPFRLTRDLLDPVLIEGTGGRLAEQAIYAMQLLRESKHVILGLASVLLRETISNFEEIDSGSGERPSFVSETAIARLRDKLNGTDDTFGQQDVHHQVRRLFTEATNVDNISRMFIGWMGFV